ncbi:MAG: radical SAM/SPASM domain-containing protein [Candidatus Woesearchaeota archaeon]
MKPLQGVVAGWSFTNRCNLKCIHCYNNSGKIKPGELTLEEAIKVADKLADSGVIAVNFGGGECGLRADFIPLCEHLHKLGIKISYTTNGTIYGELEPHLKLFSDIGVSIDFASEEKHDAFRGIKGTYRKALHTIEGLVKNNVDTEIVTCITSLNCNPEELSRIYNLAVELNVNHWRINRYRKTGRNPSIDLALTPESLKNAYEFLHTKISPDTNIPEPLYRAAFGGKYDIKGDPSGFTAFRIQPNGEVTPSVFLKINGGNIKEKSLEEIFDSEIFRNISDRHPKGKCIECNAYKHCQGGDAGASFLEYGHFDGPDPLCWLNNYEGKVSELNISEKWNVHEKYLCTLYVPIGENNESP